MNRQELNDLELLTSSDEMALRASRGASYQTSDDVLSNFKSVAAETGITPEQALWVLAQKHIKCLANFVRDGTTTSDEPIEGRIHDARNYLLFLLALVSEKKSGQITEILPKSA